MGVGYRLVLEGTPLCCYSSDHTSFSSSLSARQVKGQCAIYVFSIFLHNFCRVAESVFVHCDIYGFMKLSRVEICDLGPLNLL